MTVLGADLDMTLKQVQLVYEDRMKVTGNSPTKISEPESYLIEIELLHDAYELVR